MSIFDQPIRWLGKLAGNPSVLRLPRSTNKWELSVHTNFQMLPGSDVFVDVVGKDFQWKWKDKSYPLTVCDMGKINLTADSVISCDGYGMYGPIPYTTKTPRGEFPVLLAVIEEEQIVALARIQFSSNPVETWKLALRPGQKLEDLEDDHVFCFGVDGGAAAFVDPNVLKHFDLYEIMRRDDKLQEEIFDDHFCAILKTDKGDAAIFRSGFGDGCYASYFGYDSDGKLAAILTDLGVVDWRMDSK